MTSLAGSNTYTYNQMGSVLTDTPSGGSTTNFGYNTDTALCWSGTGSPTGASCTSPPTGSTTYGNNAINERCWSDTATASVSTSCATPRPTPPPPVYGYNTLGELTCATASGTRHLRVRQPSSTKTTTYAYNGDGLRMSDTPATKSTQQFTWDVSGSVPEPPGRRHQLPTSTGRTAPRSSSSTPRPPPTTWSRIRPGSAMSSTCVGDRPGIQRLQPLRPCSSCTANTPFGFEDGYTDANGLIYLVNRYYDPATDQFISVDPLVNVTGQPFSYANDDPVNGSDPSGLTGDAVADEQYDVQHSCKGKYASAPGCGQHWYQSASLPATVDVVSAGICVTTGAGCVVGAIVSTGTQEFHDRVNNCPTSSEFSDGILGLVATCFAGISRLGEAALEGLDGAKAAYRVHQTVPGVAAGGVSSC